MIVRYLHLVGIAILPTKTDPPLLVDPDTVLAFTIPFELLQSVSRRYPKIVDRLGSVYHYQLPVSDALHFHRQALASYPLEDMLRF